MKTILITISLLLIGMIGWGQTAGFYDSTMIHYRIDSTYIPPVYPGGDINIYIDVNLDSIDDIHFLSNQSAGQEGLSNVLKVYPLNGAEIVRFDGILWDGDSIHNTVPVAYPYDIGEDISDTSIFSSEVAYMHYFLTDPNVYLKTSDWINKGPHYVCFRITIDNELYYGWVFIDLHEYGHWGWCEITVYDVAVQQPEELPDAIDEIPLQLHRNSSEDYYDIMGRKIPKPKKGFYIECKTTDKGIISKKYFIQ